MRRRAASSTPSRSCRSPARTDVLPLAVGLVLAACSGGEGPRAHAAPRHDVQHGRVARASDDVGVDVDDDAPPDGGPAEATDPPPEHALAGFATWYGPGFAGHRTANGERFDPSKLTAAHRTLPFGTRVRVVSERTGESVIVRINDRGPFGDQGRIIDLARGAARRIGLDRAGVMRVRLEVLGEE